MSNPYTAPAADLSQVDADGASQLPQILSLSGRIGRLRYLAYGGMMLVVVIFVGANVARMLSAIHPYLGLAASLALYVAALVYAFGYARRRLHDMDASGWWSLLFLVPVVQIGLFVWLVCVPGDEWPNDFGPPPAANSRGVLAAAIAMPLIIGVMSAVVLSGYQRYTERAKAARMQSAPAPALPGASR